jgi:LacI family transcriptional regulator
LLTQRHLILKKNHPNIRDVADACGLSPATVSMALRGLARVPPSTRKRVEAAARELNYMADPEIGRILARSRNPNRTAHECFAYLSEEPIHGEAEQTLPWLLAFFEEARAACHLLGCEIQPYLIPTDLKAQQALGRKLLNVGIKGLLIAPVTTRETAEIRMNWSQFAAVDIGSTLDFPRLHRVERSYYEDCGLLYAHLCQKGYRRIGLVFSGKRRQIIRNIPEASLLLFQRHHPSCEWIEPLKAADFNSDGLLAYVKDKRPDVILVYEEEPVTWLSALSRNMRPAVAYLNATKRTHTGLVAERSSMIRDAVRMLKRMVDGGELGIPERNRIIGYRSVLQSGTSASVVGQSSISDSQSHGRP